MLKLSFSAFLPGFDPQREPGGGSSISGKPIPDKTVFPMGHHNHTTLAVDEGTADRKPVEVALIESRRYLKALFDNSLDAIVVINDDGRCIDANPSASALLGYTHEELIQLGILDLTAEAFREEGWSMWQHFLEGGTLSGEYPTARKDGTVIEVEFRAVAHILLGVHMAFSRDITERNRAEEALRQAEEKYRTIFENAVEGVFRSTADGRFITANPAMARMLGFDSPEELIRGHDGAKPNCLDSERREEFKRLLDEHGFVRGFEYQGRRKDGGKIWLSDSVRATRDESGTLLYYEGIAEDITERKVAEAALGRSERRFAAFMNNTSAQTWIKDIDFRYVYGNEQFARLLGRSLSEIVGKNDFELLPTATAEQFRANDEAVLATGKLLETQETIHTPDGELRCSRVYKFPIQDADGRQYVGGMAIDITDRKRAEDALRESEKRYRDLVENSRELICTHDLDGRVISANRAVAEALGYDSNEVLEGKNIRDALAPEVRHEFKQYMASLLERGETSGFMLVETITGERRMWEYYNSLRTEGVATPIVRSMARDITDRKRAEQALRESEKRLRTIVEGTQALLVSVNANGQFTYVNDASARAVGYASPEELIGKSYLHFVHPEDRQQVLDTFTNQANARRPSSLQEFRIIDTEGKVKWFSFLSTLVIKDGEFAGQSGVAQDITERKQVDEKLRASEEKYRTILERMEEGYAEVDLRGTYVFVNDSFCRITGRSRSELLGVNYKEVFDREQRQLLYEAYHNVYVTGEPILGFEYVVTRKDGTKRLVEESVILKKDAEGRPIGFTGIRRDCTDRKQAEEALRESEGRYRELFEQASDMIYATDESGIWRALNPAALRLLKYAEEELLGQSQFDLIRPDYREPFKEFYRQQYLQGIPHTFYSFPVVAKDGTEIWLEQNSTLLFDNDRVACFHFVARNITDRKRAEAEIAALLTREQLARQEAEVVRDANVALTQNLSIETVLDTLLAHLGKLIPYDSANVMLRESETKFAISQLYGYEEFQDVDFSRPIALDLSENALLRQICTTGKSLLIADTEAEPAWQKLPGAEHVRCWLGVPLIAYGKVIGLYSVDKAEPGVFTPEHVRMAETLAAQAASAIQNAQLFEQGQRYAAELEQRIAERERAEERLRVSHAQLRALSARLQKAKEEEGTRIAREIHDELGSALTTLRWGLEEIGGVLTEPLPEAGLEKVRENIETLTTLIDGTLSTIRRISSELRPGILDDAGLLAAIEWAAKQFETRSGITCRFESLVQTVDLSREQSTAVFRIFQEALTNVLRHAEATRVEITINEEAGKFVMIIRDNGKGITEKRQSGPDTLGIVGMRERAHLIGGEMTITGTPGQGTVVSVFVPTGRT